MDFRRSRSWSSTRNEDRARQRSLANCPARSQAWFCPSRLLGNGDRYTKPSFAEVADGDLRGSYVGVLTMTWGVAAPADKAVLGVELEVGFLDLAEDGLDRIGSLKWVGSL